MLHFPSREYHCGGASGLTQYTLAFPDHASNCVASSTAGVFSKLVEHVLQPLYLRLGLTEVLLKSVFHLFSFGAFLHFTEPLHQLVFSVVNTFQLT